MDLLQATEQEQKPGALNLSAFVGNRVSRKEIARALNCGVDTVDNISKGHNNPYINLLGERAISIWTETGGLDRQARGCSASRQAPEGCGLSL